MKERTTKKDSFRNAMCYLKVIRSFQTFFFEQIRKKGDVSMFTFDPTRD